MAAISANKKIMFGILVSHDRGPASKRQPMISHIVKGKKR